MKRSGTAIRFAWVVFGTGLLSIGMIVAQRNPRRQTADPEKLVSRGESLTSGTRSRSLADFSSAEVDHS